MNRMERLAKLAMAAAGALALGAMHTAGAVAEGAADPAEAPPEGMTQPKYAEDGKLLVPENYRKWVFVGASIGLSYAAPKKTEAKPENYKEGAQPEAQKEEKGPGLFHHTYMQPEAYDRYCETGKFPEKTMMILELYEPQAKVAPDKNGFAQGQRIAIEVAIKDHSHFEEGWAYFNFPLKDNKPPASARANPKPVCYSCHEAHAAENNVFTQFYPTLREAREKREAAASPKAE